MTAKTDRELLGLAAKAAGYEPVRMEDGSLLLYGIQEPWNPLTVNSDVFSLAVKLNLSITFDSFSDGPVVQVGANWHEEFPERWWTEWLGKDAEAATRRAIVRAAAAIGETL